MGSPQLYDDIAFDYAAIKTNPFKVRCEEPSFWHALGDVSEQHILDLACGSGHFSRELRKRGAASVTAVDISPEMIAMAEAEETTAPLGNITYHVGSASQYEAVQLVDCVTAQYLFPYAKERAELDQMCGAACAALKPGGRFVCLSTSWFEGAVTKSEGLGYSAQGVLGEEGCEVQLTLFGEGGQTRVTFPNYLWSREATEAALLGAGFESVEYQQLICLLYTSPSPRDRTRSRMPSSA
eukprot:TRINITY_DN27621_c0_g1_i2.p1 TRINITY_DN27621_c0_g1~~TRINITY_DN27621_c0_g1_i2.p1  ORF type:complete len:239 (-),score=41.89 TRINITY_DN27621_c0_g1_i2:39-755(-)